MVLTKEDILKAFEEIGEIANERGVIIDIGVYGGSAIALQWEFRRSTRDVDIVVFGDPQFLREAAATVADRHGWPDNWINDAVKGFVSVRQDLQMYLEFPKGTESPGLRVFTPTPEYLLAMKCMAMRTGSGEHRKVNSGRAHPRRKVLSVQTCNSAHPVRNSGNPGYHEQGTEETRIRDRRMTLATKEKTEFSRPESLYEYSAELASGNPSGWTVEEFLDSFYGSAQESRQKMIDQEPKFLSGKMENGEFVDAYLAAVAEYLAWHHSLQVPEWTQNPRRWMKEPWFASEIEGLKPLLAMESPAAFRRRNLFVSKNALARA